MKLEELFKKYPDDRKAYRKSRKHMTPVTVEWLTGLHAWGNEESRQMGFLLPQFMITDAIADDWEIVDQ